MVENTLCVFVVQENMWLAALVDAVHILLIPLFWIVPVVVLKTCETRWLIVMNLTFYVLFVSFALFERCILTVLYNHLQGLPRCTPFVYLWERYHRNKTKAGDDDCRRGTSAWIRTNAVLACLYLVVNVYFWRRCNI